MCVAFTIVTDIRLLAKDQAVGADLPGKLSTCIPTCLVTHLLPRIHPFLWTILVH